MSGFRCLCRVVTCAICATMFCAPLSNAQISSLSAIDDPATQKPADTKKYTLSGTVVNSQTGEGVPRALVELNNQIVTLTDSNGGFAFEGIAAGTYYVSSRKPGYFDRQQSFMGQSPAAMTEVSADTSITVKLTPEAVIFGRVTDSDGLPVHGLPMQCLRSMVMDGRRQWQPAGSSNTDSDGEYRMAGLAPGIYLLVAGPSQAPSIGTMAKVGSQDAGYPAVYYPAPDAGGSAAGLRITAGQKVSADLSVQAEPFYTVSGSFNAPPGFNVWLNLTPSDSAHVQRANGMIQREGNTFTVHMLPRGDYVLQANSRMQNKMWTASVPLHVRSDLAGVQVALQPAISIPVSVDIERTRPAAEASTVTRLGMQASATVMLHSTDQAAQQQMFMAAYQRQNDTSSLAVDGVVPGTYRTDVHSAGDYYVASARYGSTDLLRENLVVAPSASQDPIEVVLRDDGGSVKGTVTSEGHSARGTLLIVSDYGPPYVAMQQPGADGDFNLQQLRPGSYSILAFDTVDDLEYANPDALDPYMSHAAHVDLAANQEATVSLELIKRGDQ